RARSLLLPAGRRGRLDRRRDRRLLLQRRPEQAPAPLRRSAALRPKHAVADRVPMTGHILLLCLANLLMLAVGAGLLPVLRLAHSRRDVVGQLPLAYAVGLAATGIVAANLALVDVSVGRLGLPLLAAGS